MKSTIILPLLAAVVSAETGTGPGPSPQGTFYEAANQHPNATGTKPILGVNMTNPPEVGQPVEWNAFINVTEVVGDTTIPSGEVVTNTVLSLNSNGNFVEGNSSNFQTCVVVMTDVARNATVKGQNDKGLCAEAFGKDCAIDWEQAISSASILAANTNRTSANGTCGGMTMPQIPPSCAGSFTTNFLAFDIEHLNQTMGEGLIYSSSEPHNASNLTFYDEAVTQLWPVILIQSPAQRYAGGGGLYSAQMSCLRAGNISDGSQKVTSVPGASTRVEISIWSLLAVAAVMAVLL